MASKPPFVVETVKLGELISKASSQRCGNDSYPVLSMTMHNGIVEQKDRFKKAVASKDTSTYKVVYPNQLVVGFPIDEGVIYVQNHNFAGIMSPAYKIWDIDTAKVDPAYLELALHSPQSMAHYSEKMRGTTARRRSITDANLRALALPLPELAEQRRVIGMFKTLRTILNKGELCFELLDKLIKSRFVEMFSSCSKNVYLGDVCKFQSGKTVPKEKELPQGDYLYAKVGDLNLPGNEVEIRFSRSYLDVETARKNLIPKGAVVFPKRGGAIGTNKKRITSEPCCLDLNLMSVIPGEQICTPYLLAWFDQMDLADISNGSTVPQINNKDLNGLIIPLPDMLQQQQFADFVSQVDKSRFVSCWDVPKVLFLFHGSAFNLVNGPANSSPYSSLPLRYARANEFLRKTT